MVSEEVAVLGTERNFSRWLFHLAYWTFVLAGYGLLVYLIQNRAPGPLPWPALLVFFAFLWGADTRLGESQASGGRVMSSKCIVLAVIWRIESKNSNCIFMPIAPAATTSWPINCD